MELTRVGFGLIGLKIIEGYDEVRVRVRVRVRVKMCVMVGVRVRAGF